MTEEDRAREVFEQFDGKSFFAKDKHGNYTAFNVHNLWVGFKDWYIRKDHKISALKAKHEAEMRDAMEIIRKLYAYADEGIESQFMLTNAECFLSAHKQEEPEYCEWTKTEWSDSYSIGCSDTQILYNPQAFRACPECGKPIRIKADEGE
ncbi:MAG: hypothetical protein PVJ39_04660 [Gammaproteobacteria bacterium]|jgi:hypothetical protein